MKLADKYSLTLADLPSSVVESRGIRKAGITIGILAGVYFIPSLPPVRIFLHYLLPELFKPCTVLLGRIIEFSEEKSENEDMFFVIYHILIYTLFVFVLPILMLLWYIKTLSDMSSELERRSRLNNGTSSQSSSLLDAVDCALTVVVVCSVFCSVRIVKLALLMFQLSNYGLYFLGDAGAFFTVITIVVNLLLILQSFSYLPVTLAVSVRFRWLMMRALLFIPRLCHRKFCLKTQRID